MTPLAGTLRRLTDTNTRYPSTDLTIASTVKDHPSPPDLA